MILSQMTLSVLAILASGISASPVSVAEGTTSLRARQEPNITAVDAAEPHSLAKRSFIWSCWGLVGPTTNGYFTLRDGHILEGQCKRSDASGGAWIPASLDLNLCLTNKNGDLQWKANGIFKWSCPTSYLRHGLVDEFDVYLAAECRTASGSLKFTQINLDTYIHNWDGALTCNPPS